MWEQLVNPNLSATSPAGWCLAFAQKVYGAPVMYRSAWEAWENTQDKRYDALPNVSVPVWFSHFGTYQGEYANWGHVVAYVPGRGFLSSPASGVGQQWVATIEQVERIFNSKYVGWSTDINTLQVAQYVQEDEDMAQGAFYRSPAGKIVWQEKPNTVLIPLSLVTWTAYSVQGNKFTNISQKDFDALIKQYGTAPVPPSGGGTVTVPDFKISMSGEAVKK
jgi:hypothetical protein